MNRESYFKAITENQQLRFKLKRKRNSSVNPTTHSASGLYGGSALLEGPSAFKAPRKSSQLKPSERFNTYQATKETDSVGEITNKLGQLESQRVGARNRLAKISMTSEGSPRPPIHPPVLGSHRHVSPSKK